MRKVAKLGGESGVRRRVRTKFGLWMSEMGLEMWTEGAYRNTCFLPKICFFTARAGAWVNWLAMMPQLGKMKLLIP